MWSKIEDSLLIYNSNINYDFKQNHKIISFDLDDTIIKTKSNKKLPINKEDWIFKYNSNNKIIEEFNNGNTNIIIFSNQSTINNKGYNKQIEDDIKYKIENIINQLNILIIVFIASKNDKYRKPNNNMWNKMLEIIYNDNIDLNNCLYVGDAAGRDKNKYHKKDFADTDYKFALNIGINFKTPEEYFNIDNAKEIFNLNYFDFNLLNKIPNSKIKLSNDKELIIFVGFPGCGKSTFYKNNCNNYVHINQDELKTKAKCLKLCLNSMKNNKNIVIDNTNPSKEIRKNYIDMAKEYNYKCRCIYFNIDFLLAKHMNYYRAFTENKILIPEGDSLKTTPSETLRVPDIGYNLYKSKFEMPELNEGFEDIITIYPNIIFDNEINKKLFFKYYF